ncbi:MAG: hypothetical protein NPINA01_03000 [Nitrospinaceae bacterium]|nr:MAG: hypothetical protein NPINA01_03000 [Nitrospinaceae bacterium]
MFENEVPHDPSKPLSETRVCIVSYTWKDEKGQASHIAGPPQDLYRYLKTRAKEVIFIEQPQSYCPDITPTLTVCKMGVERKPVRFPMFWFPYNKTRADIQQTPFPYVAFKVRDILSTIYFLLYLRRRFDLYVGVEAVNTIIGLLLRRFKVVKRVVYDVIDYSPKRFDNLKLNGIFHFMDRYCAHRADWAWAQSSRVEPMRLELGAKANQLSPHILKQSGFGTDASCLKMGSKENFDPYRMAYVGALHPTDGVDCLVEAMPLIIEKVPNARLTIVGDGMDAPKLRCRVQELALEKNVQFLGTIGNPTEIENLLASCALGIVPYKKDPLSLKHFNDPSKPRLYLGCGLPVIITDVPEVAQDIHQKKAGLIIDWTPVSLADAVVSLLTDQDKLTEFRSNSLRMAEDFTWDRIFSNIFSQMGFK